MTTEAPFRRLLFAVDDTDASRLALPLVAGYARAWRADLHVMHVHDPEREPAGARADGALVTRMVDALSQVGLSASGQVHVIHEGPIGPAIARVAGQQEVDLVVVGSHGRTGLDALFAPSVSHRVAAELSTPVLVARVAPGLRTRPVRIVAAIDASPAGELAIADVIRAARPTDAAVRVVHVLEPAGGPPVALEAGDAAGRLVDRAIGAVQGAGLDADGEVVLSGGSVAEAIAVAARRFDADLVVVASRRPSGLEGFIAGSVAYELIHALDRPVLLAHRG